MTRKSDNGDEIEGYKKRRMFDPKTLYIFMAALIGPAGVTGIINSYTDPNIKLQSRIETVEIETKSQSINILGLKGKVAKREMRVENYIKSHDVATDLRQRINDTNVEHIMELLKEIKQDVKDLKTDVHNTE